MTSKVVGGPGPAKRDFSGGAPSPNIGGSGGKGVPAPVAEKEKKGKFWQRSKRYADLP